MALQSAISSRNNVRNRLVTCAHSMMDSISSRCVGKNNTTNWNTISGSDNTVIASLSARRNPLAWAADLHSQLNCAVSCKSAWLQSVGGVAITPRHVLACGHVRDDFIGITARFINDSGEFPVDVVTKTIIKTFQIANTTPIVFEGNSYDLRVWLLDSDLPSWVYKCPIVTIPASFENMLLIPPLGVPQINITQGYSSGSPTQFQRMSVLNSTNPYQFSSNTLSSFYHSSYTGDSGTPAFVIINNKLYLRGIVVGFSGGAQAVWKSEHVRHINELIRLVDLEAGITTGYSVSAVEMSTLA